MAVNWATSIENNKQLFRKNNISGDVDIFSEQMLVEWISMYFRGRKNFTVMSEVFNHTLFRNMEIMLDKMTKQNAPKFAINL